MIMWAIVDHETQRVCGLLEAPKPLGNIAIHGHLIEFHSVDVTPEEYEAFKTTRNPWNDYKYRDGCIHFQGKPKDTWTNTNKETLKLAVSKINVSSNFNTLGIIDSNEKQGLMNDGYANLTWADIDIKNPNTSPERHSIIYSALKRYLQDKGVKI